MNGQEAEVARQNSMKLKRMISDRSGERETLHRKTFTKWVNARLAQHDPPMEIKDVVVDFMDGKMMLNMMEVLCNTKLKKEKGNLRVHKLNNVEQAMKLLEKQKVKLVGINAFDIVDGKPRVILGLMWSVILRFQVQEIMQETVTEETAKSFNVEKKLLDWCKERLKGYEDHVAISDFSSSWRNGLAFNALIHSYGPRLFDFNAIAQSSTRARLDNSFKMAEKHFGVPRYLDSTDIDVEKPDKKLIIMYLTEMYNYLEGNKAKERKASAVMAENPCVIESAEAVEGALNDGFDNLDGKAAISQSENDKAVADLNKKLNEVESGLSDAEHNKPVYDDDDSLDLEEVTKLLEEQKKFRQNLEPLKSRTYEVLNEGRSMVGEGYFDLGGKEHFQDRMDNVDRRLQNLLEQSQKDQDKLSQERFVLLKQQLNKMTIWLKKAEQKMDKEGDIGPTYEIVKEQLEEHQKFQEEVGDMSLVASVLRIDLTDPDLDGKTREQIKTVNERWATAWNWSEDRNQKLTKAMIDWQKFRDEELILLNWLSQKEKTLKEVSNTDVADEQQVKESLELLEKTQKELEEQEERLQRLRQLGKDLIEDSGSDEETTKEIEAQLQDFDDCWNHVAKRVIDEKEKLINTQNKMREMYDLVDSVNQWVDDGKALMNEYNEDLPSDERENLKKRAQIKLEEKPSMQVKVDRVNRLGKDVCEILDGPSQRAVKGELQQFNDRWQDVCPALESFSDKGYSDVNGNECCIVRIMKRKFKSLS